MTMAWTEHRHADADAAAQGLAHALAQDVAVALATEANAVVALAGGRTPFAAYRLLARQPLDWCRIHLLPGDERCVPHDHHACNATALRKAFDGTGAIVEHLTVPSGDPDASLMHARTLLRTHSGPFASVVLGMGLDGHVASLFAGAPQFMTALHPRDGAAVARIDPEPLPVEAPFPRITLTLPRLLDARRVHLLVTGHEKRSVLEAAMAANAPLLLPVSAVLHAPESNVQIHWSP